jgi:hypothetical protein
MAGIPFYISSYNFKILTSLVSLVSIYNQQGSEDFLMY